MSANNEQFRMSPFAGDEEDDHLATPDDLASVQAGKATPEQIARVKAALRDPDSPLSQWWQKEKEDLAKLTEGLRWRGRIPPPGTPFWDSSGVDPAAKNLYRLINYMRHKRDEGVLTAEETKSIIMDAGKGKAGQNPNPTNSDYAMMVARMVKLLSKAHPELASEIHSIPASSANRSR